MDKVNKNKRGLELVTSPSTGYKTSGFRVIPKITPANLCKPMHDIINYSNSICPFKSGKSGKEEEKIPREQKELFR